MGAGKSNASGPPPGVKPGAVTALLEELVQAPDEPGVALPAFQPGQIVGRFVLLREIGRGGFGQVFEARDRELGRSVAFKALWALSKLDPGQERLFHEAEAAARLSHPNIVTLYDVGRCEQGPYLVLELLNGRTLAERRAQGALSLREALRIGVEVVKGVAHAHAHGVVHRDLTPGNVFLCDDGQVKVLDFGMAHAFGQRKVDGGTRAYMAPEQARGAPEDERTDVFALGVILHEILSGERPFPDAEALASSSPAPGLEVPEAPAVGELVGRMLEKDPVKRPREAGEVLSALTAFQRELERLPATGSARVRTRRRPWGLADFVAELKRRRVIRALVGYAIVSFAILQIVEPVLHRLHLPDWTLGLVVLLLAAGFSVTVALSWIFDLAAGGIERTPPAPPPGIAEAPHRMAGPRLALLLAALGILSAAPGLGWYFVLRGRERPGLAAPSDPGGAGPKGAEASPRTVAVLPLVNLSGDATQEYFSDGMTEEITSRLSRLAGLAVTARTSAMRYKGSQSSAREIGAELAVAYLVEGSVRRAGDRIRVAASLVRTVDAVRLWSEDQDARIDDVFAVQERIAGRIVEALGVKLTPGEERVLHSWGTRNPAAYDEYLQGMAKFGEDPNVRPTLDAASAHFQKALAIDDAFAPALAGLAACEAMVYRNWESLPRHLDRAEALAGRALALDPELVPALKAAADVRGFRFDYAGAAEQYRRITDLAPRYGVAWDQLCWALGYTLPLELDEAEAACRRAIELQPRYAASWYHLLRVHVLAGRIDEAEAELAEMQRLSAKSDLVVSGRFWIALGRGRPADALRSLEGRTTNLDDAWRVMALAQLGRKDRAFEALEAALSGGYRDVADLRGSRWYEPLRRDPRWAAALARHGLAP